jgi:transposase
MRLSVCVDPVDFRKGIDGLVRICRDELAEDPFRGTLSVLRIRRATAVKVLASDGQGFWLGSPEAAVDRDGLAGGLIAWLWNSISRRTSRFPSV